MQSQDNRPANYIPREEEVGVMARFKGWLIPLRRYWWVCIPTILIGFAHNYYETSQIPVRYTSHGEMALMGQLNLPDNNYYQEVYTNFFGDQANLMNSSMVGQRARERVVAMHPELAEVNQQVSLRVNHKDGTSSFELSATGAHAKYVQYFLDAIMEEYLNFRQENRSSRTDATLAQINIEIQRLDGEIHNLENEKQEFLSANNMVFIREQADSAANYLVSLNRKLADFENEQQLIELFTQQRAQDLASSDFSIDELLGQDSNYIQSLQRLKFLRAERERFSSVLRPVHPKMKRFDNEINQLEIILEVQRKQGAQDLVKKKKNLEIRITNVNKTIEEWEARSVELSRKLGEFERIDNRLDRLKKLYDQRVASLDKIQTARNVTLEPISIIKHATSATPIKPNPIKDGVSGATMGFFVGLGLIVAIRLWRATIYTEHDLPDSPNIRSVAYIPRLTGKSRVTLIHPKDKRYAFLEAFRNLRSFILMEFQRSREKQAMVISITSAIPSEGKSTVSSNLALSFAYSGHKTLLIDADMRQGTQHRAFNFNNDKGLTELLDGSARLSEVKHVCKDSGLTVITRGSAMMNSSELLLTPASKELFERVRNEYDVVIIDTPPVMATDDVANILNYIDAVFIVARMSLSTSKALENAIQMLRNRRAQIGGYVLNSCDASSTDYYRYKYYGYYGRNNVLEDEQTKEKQERKRKSESKDK